jgi:nucleoside-diphosphate-sugar epimerase
MRILITGAAGMVGRKLVARLLQDRQLAGRTIAAIDLHDIVAPETPQADGISVRASPATSPQRALRKR